MEVRIVGAPLAQSMVNLEQDLASGTCLVVAPTYIQNGMSGRFSNLSLNLSSSEMKKAVADCENFASPPSLIEVGIDIHRWDKIIFIGCTFSLMEHKGLIKFMTPADQVLRNALFPRPNFPATEVIIHSEIEVANGVVAALKHWRDTEKPKLVINYMNEVQHETVA